MTIGERAYKAISDRAAEIGMEVKEYAKTIGIDPRNPRYRETGYSEHRAYLLSRLVEAGLDAYWILTGQSVDKVEVVRCKDCMYYDAKIHRCDHPNLNYDVECYDQWIDTEPDDFCSYGERRSENAAH